MRTTDKSYGRVYSIGEVKQNGHIREIPILVGETPYMLEMIMTCVFVDGIHIGGGKVERAIRTAYLSASTAPPEWTEDAWTEFLDLVKPYLTR